MLEAAIIGRWHSTPGLFPMRRGIRRLRRFNWRWRLAFTRKPPGGERSRGVKYLDYSPKPGGFRVSLPRSASHYAWLRTNSRYIGEPGGIMVEVIEEHVSPDGRLCFRVTHDIANGVVILSFAGYCWHTHPDLLASAYGLSEPEAVRKCVDDLLAD